MKRIERYKQLLTRHVEAGDAPAAARVLERMARIFEESGDDAEATIYRDRARAIAEALPSEPPSSGDSVAQILPFPGPEEHHHAVSAPAAVLHVDFERSHLMRRIHSGEKPGEHPIVCYRGEPCAPQDPAARNLPRPLGIYGDLRREANRLRALGVWYLRKKEWEQARECLERAAELSREVGRAEPLAHTLWFLGQAALGQSDQEAAREAEQELHEVISDTRDPRYHYLARLLTLRLTLLREDALQIVVAFAGFVKIAEETPRPFIFSHPPYTTLKSLVDYFIALRDFTMAKEAVNQLKKLTRTPTDAP